MKIKKIKYLKPDTYEITFDDDVLVIPANLIFKYDLLRKKQITTNNYQQLKHDLIYYDELNRVLKYIGYRLRSKSEIAKYIAEFVYQTEIMDYLIAHQYVNDTKFAQAFVNDKWNFTKDGVNKIRHKLSAYQVADEIIEDALRMIDDEMISEKLTKIINGKIVKNKKYSRKILWQKILEQCLALGYDKEMIVEIFTQQYVFDINVIMKEKKRLEQKYSCSDEIKRKLYHKGFTSEEIKKVID